MSSRFVYEETVSINMTNVEKILYAAEKYDVEKLKLKCGEFLTKNFVGSTRSNVLHTLELSQQYQLSSLSKKALEYIAVKPKEYLESDEFTDLSKDGLKSILNFDFLPLKEIDVYNATLSWAETKCEQQKLSFSDENIRQVLGEILYLIRFPTMGINTFCKEVVCRNVLTPIEKVAIFTHFSDQSPECSNFESNPRKVFYTVFRTNEHIDGIWMCPICTCTTESISFCLLNNCYIGGILTYKKNGQANYTVSLKKNAEIMSSVDGNSNYAHTDNPKIVELHFPKIYQLTAGIVYTIELNFTSGHSIQGFSKSCKQVVEFDKNKVKFSVCPSSTSTNVQSGLIPGLILSCIEPPTTDTKTNESLMN